jgi:hypothetical protein
MLILFECKVQWMWRKVLAWLSKGVVPIATPGVTGRVIDHICPYRVELNIALAIQLVDLCLNEGSCIHGIGRTQQSWIINH